MATTVFGQLVVGPPGSGKSTYCKYICENLRQLGRNAKIINLDPANDCLPYKPAIDITNLVNVDSVMESASYGPNGAMIYCMEALQKNSGWLFDQMVTLIADEKKKYEEMQIEKKKLKANKDDSEEPETDSNIVYRPYFLIDCPGQSELYTHYPAVRDVIKDITKSNQYIDLRLVCMNLCDAYHASDLGKFISVVMNSLSTMLNLELPHVNVLSKVDKMESYGPTRFNLDFYREIPSMKYLLETELESAFNMKYRKLSEVLCDVIDDYSLVSYIPLDIRKAEDIKSVLVMADKASGYCVEDLDLSILQLNPTLMEMASGRRLEPMEDATLALSQMHSME